MLAEPIWRLWDFVNKAIEKKKIKEDILPTLDMYTHKASTKSDFKCVFVLSCYGQFCHFIRITKCLITHLSFSQESMEHLR